MMERPQMRNAFDFSKIRNKHLFHIESAEAYRNAKQVNYFLHKIKVDLILDFFKLSHKMLLFTMCHAAKPNRKLNNPIDK